jgi:hypothetical protein
MTTVSVTLLNSSTLSVNNVHTIPELRLGIGQQTGIPSIAIKLRGLNGAELTYGALPTGLSEVTMVIDYESAITQLEQMKRSGCYKDIDGHWKFPVWADTEELKTRAMVAFATNSTDAEREEFFENQTAEEAAAEVDEDDIDDDMDADDNIPARVAYCEACDGSYVSGHGHVFWFSEPITRDGRSFYSACQACIGRFDIEEPAAWTD